MDPRLVALKSGLKNWRKKFAEQNDINENVLIAYTSNVLMSLQNQIRTSDTETEGVDPFDGTTPGSEALNKAVRRIQKSFVISYVDKFSSKFMFTCPKFYAQTLLRNSCLSL